MKKFIAILITAAIFTGSLFAQSNEQALEKFKTANDLYSKGKFIEAAELYEEIVNNDYESYELYYNLGNAYFKLEEIPSAILFYERAKKLAPDDEDVNFNLQIAKLKTVDKIEPVPQFFMEEWVDSISELFSLQAWTALGLIFAWLAFTFLAAFLMIWSPLWKKTFFAAGIISFVIMAASIFFAYEENTELTADDSAIVFTPSVYVKSSPSDEGTNLFILHEGTKVQILDEVGEWQKIRIADGNVGWLPKESVEII